MLAPAYPINRLVQLLGYVELVVHDQGRRHGRTDTFQVRFPHVHRDGRNALALCLGNRRPQRIGRRARAFRHDIQHAPPVDVMQHGNVVMTAPEALLIEPDVDRIIRGAPLQAAAYARSMIRST